MTNQDVHGNLFGKWQIAPNTWCITNRWANFMYLLIGEEKAMLIDTGSAEGNLREFVETITDKPIMVVNTHGHFDHTGGNSCWAKAWMTKEAAKCAKIPFSPMHKEWFDSKGYPDYQIQELSDGDIVELGNRQVEVIAIGAHSEGSIALLDRTIRAMFTGDELESGQVLWFVRDHALPRKEVAALHKRNMEKLLSYRKEYDWLWPAHNGVPLLPDIYLQDFITLDEQVMAGTAKVMPNTGGFGFPTDASQAGGPFAQFGKLERVEYGTASVVYPAES